MVLINEGRVCDSFAEFTADVSGVFEVGTDDCDVRSTSKRTSVGDEVEHVWWGIEVEEDTIISPFLTVERELTERKKELIIERETKTN